MNIQFSSGARITVRRFSTAGELDEFSTGRDLLEIGDRHRVQESSWLVSIVLSDCVAELRVFPSLDHLWDVCSLEQGVVFCCARDMAIFGSGRDPFIFELESQFDEFKILKSGERVACWQSGVGMFNAPTEKDVFLWTFDAPDLIAGVVEEDGSLLISFFEVDMVRVAASTGFVIPDF